MAESSPLSHIKPKCSLCLMNHLYGDNSGIATRNCLSAGARMASSLSEGNPEHAKEELLWHYADEVYEEERNIERR